MFSVCMAEQRDANVEFTVVCGQILAVTVCDKVAGHDGDDAACALRATVKMLTKRVCLARVDFGVGGLWPE